MSEVKVNKISPRSGTAVTLGDSGDTITIPSGVTLANSGTIDSSERVGIGTSSPGRQLQLSSTDPQISLLSTNTSSGSSAVHFGDSNDDNVGQVNYQHADNSMRLITNASEAMRIDSSGNLLVGTTSDIPGVGNTTLGVSLRNNNGGSIAVSRSGDRAGYFNRNTSDGDIIQFRKDGTAIGSIGAKNSKPYFASTGSGATGITFGSDKLILSNQDGVIQDNSRDIGSSSERIKDIYLGGGAFIGGTGTANKLDDYEEGNWTPVINSGTYSYLGYATYTKIGNQCHLHFRIGNFSDTSSATDIQITGMPFTQPSNTEDGVGSAYGERTDVNKPTVCMNSNIIRFRNGFGVSTFDTPLQYSDINNGGDFDVIASVTYQTN